jgi:hypothetical protein
MKKCIDSIKEKNKKWKKEFVQYVLKTFMKK